MNPSSSSKPDLVKKILSEIKIEGKITFARFMELALYDLQDGYYSSERNPIGAQGDYFTTPQVHSIYGRLMARQIIEMLKTLMEEQTLTIMEMGAGCGDLMVVILDEIKNKDPEFYKKLQCLMIERSDFMIKRQKEKLNQAGHEQKITWYSDLDPIKKEGGITGCIFSNELVDAFPVHRVVMTDAGLKEIYLSVKDDKIIESVDDLDSPEISRYFDGFRTKLSIGQQAEVNLKANQWIRSVGAVLNRGVLFTSDYGHTAPDLYSPQRMKGTLLCYYRHTVSDHPFDHIGEQDITSHVNFTALTRVGSEVGLQLTGFTDQQHFLLSMGLAQEMEGLDPQSDEFQSMKQLINPGSMGRTFKILIQHKGLSAPSLKGLIFSPHFKDSLFG